MRRMMYREGTSCGGWCFSAWLVKFILRGHRNSWTTVPTCPVWPLNIRWLSNMYRKRTSDIVIRQATECCGSYRYWWRKCGWEERNVDIVFVVKNGRMWELSFKCQYRNGSRPLSMTESNRLASVWIKADYAMILRRNEKHVWPYLTKRVVWISCQFYRRRMQSMDNFYRASLTERLRNDIWIVVLSYGY